MLEKTGAIDARFETGTTISGAGVYKAPFSIFAHLGPDSCIGITCPNGVTVTGTGLATMNIVPMGFSFPNLFQVAGTTVVFGAPEPSTSSLLLLGFAGLAVLSCRRRFRATLPPAG
jgi:hypothetical protein